MKQDLILITNGFPFGYKEAFLEKEMPYLARSFNHIKIISKNNSDNLTREIPENTKVFRYNPTSTLKDKLKIPILFLKFPRIIIRDIFNELLFLGKEISLPKLSVLIHDLIKGLQLITYLKNNHIKRQSNKKLLLYSYWFDSSSYAISYFSRFENVRCISRAHGSDLYFSVHKRDYLSLRKNTSEKLSSLFFISEFGRAYFINLINKKSENLKISRLGVKDNGIAKYSSFGCLYLLSCSNINEIKRVHLIITALALIKKEKICWTHIGDGPLINETKTLAHKILSKKNNINFQFLNQLSNKQVLSFYLNNLVDLFISTSKSEGIPVSMMEAISFGVPLLSTDVGGVKEIVTTKTGFLMPSNPSEESIAKSIINFINLDENEKIKLRKSARTYWNNKFNADKNFQLFINQIESL